MKYLEDGFCLLCCSYSPFSDELQASHIYATTQKQPSYKKGATMFIMNSMCEKVMKSLVTEFF